jgi:hypothetical protein
LQKQALALSLLEMNDAAYRYIWNFDSLAASEDAGSLNRKMAVFLADGNNFGSPLRDAFSAQDSVGQPAGIKTFDNVPQTKCKEFPRRSLEAAADPL